MGIKIKSKLIICLFISFIICADYSIKTESGITDGKLKNKVIYWNDIPYAQPPVGELRWKAPRKIINSDINIIPKDDNFCVQKTSSLGGSAQLSSENISGSEDCLYLDILHLKIRPVTPYLLCFGFMVVEILLA